jgi:choline/glycine/proline betaine transport protein
VNAFTGVEGEAWQASWTSFYWGWWIAWAPFVGVFIARVSKGRTVRQFVTGVIIVPTLIGILWFSVLGGTAIAIELTNPGTLVGEDGTVELQGALFAMLAQVPGGQVLAIGVIILIGVFFITSADSGALVMGMLASGGQIHPARWVKVFFVVITALLAAALLLSGGLIALQTAAIIIALPFSVVMLLICWSTVIAFSRERRAYALARRAQFVDDIGDFYGLDADDAGEEPAPVRPALWPWPLRRRPAAEPAGVAVTTASALPDPEPSTVAIDTLLAVEQQAIDDAAAEDIEAAMLNLGQGGDDEGAELSAEQADGSTQHPVDRETPP